MTPNPRWGMIASMSILFRLRPGQLRYDFERLKAAYERARYGWSKLDIMLGFSDTVLPAIGHQLVWFADNTNGFPGVRPYENFEDWADDLHTFGAALIEVNEEPELTASELDHYAGVYSEEAGTAVFPHTTPEFVRDNALREAIIEERREAAQDALGWLSEWHGALWD